MIRPLVSVIIPTFRRLDALPHAVTSVLRQEVAAVEVLVLDDDPEASAAPVIAAIDDPRVRYVRHVPATGGVPAVVRNHGLGLAAAPYLHFLDDDDEVVAGTYSAAVSALRARADAAFAVGTIEPFGSDPAVLAQQRAYFDHAARRMRATRSRWELAATMLFRSSPFVNGACVVRRACAEALRGYDATIPRCEGLEFYLRAVRRFGFVFVDRPFLRYRCGEPSLMHSLQGDGLLVESYRRIHRSYRRRHTALEFHALRAVALLTAAVGAGM